MTIGHRLQVLGLKDPAAELEAATASDEEATEAATAAAPAAAAAAPVARRGAFTSRRGRPPLYSYFRSVKKQFPKAVALVRVRLDPCLLVVVRCGLAALHCRGRLMLRVIVQPVVPHPWTPARLRRKQPLGAGLLLS